MTRLRVVAAFAVILCFALSLSLVQSAPATPKTPLEAMAFQAAAAHQAKWTVSRVPLLTCAQWDEAYAMYTWACEGGCRDCCWYAYAAAVGKLFC